MYVYLAIAGWVIAAVCLIVILVLVFTISDKNTEAKYWYDAWEKSDREVGKHQLMDILRAADAWRKKESENDD